ncbi:MAG: Nif3-like dinuclear metal center hexameric protein [Gammaproteobacteria bacterium AqS3]|nr:Nif3-like dinuclear metal center hexameric protein [Gammaproteobacteria bacterium AqS3]
MSDVSGQRVPLQRVCGALDELLKPGRFRDYAPNGLQVEGRDSVGLLVTGVTASLEFIRRAAEAGADAVLVHHGWFWQNEPRVLTGPAGARVRLLMRHDISLLGYHLPLDAHPELGNNAQLGRVLGWRTTGPLEDGENPLGCTGELPDPLDISALADHIAEALGREPLVVGSGPERVRTVGWCTGAAQGWLGHAVARGCDAFLTGEISEQHYHAAHEAGIHFIAAGHHATERYGVQAVGERLAAQLGLRHRFIEVANPV